MFQILNSKSVSDISQSPEYNSFRSIVPQKKLVVDEDTNKVWTYYEAGPRSVTCPLIFLPPVSGTADTFFYQIISLTALGYRVISIEYPVYWTIREWNIGFQKFLERLGLDKVHVFGASLGGFLAQKFAEATFQCPRVHSLILCNSFADTSIFNYTDTSVLFWMFPAVILKKMVMRSFSKGKLDPSIADSIDFMVEKLDGMSQAELASRLTLNCMNCYVEPHKLQGISVTALDVFDESALSPSIREEMYKLYPDAKRAHLKQGGNFPYLSCRDEVNMHIQIHLRQFIGTKYSAREGDDQIPTSEDPAADLQE